MFMEEDEVNSEDNIIIEDIVELTELEEKEKENAELKEKIMRNHAEFDNFRKRTVKEKANMYNEGVISVVEKLLPIVDNFERAILSEEIGHEEKGRLYQGITMISQQISDFLKEIELEEIDCIGKEFDPNLHNGIMKVEDSDLDENTVVEVMQKGYVLKGKVVRHSMVKVAN